MTGPPPRRRSTWVDDAIGGVRSIGLEALIVVVLGVVAVIVAWVVLTVV